MKFASLATAFTVLTMTAQSLPLGQNAKSLTGDKRDLHDLCGRWFCGHTKREEASIVGTDESPITDSELHTSIIIKEKTIREQASTTSDKRDLHDLCGRWFCGHTRKRSVILRNNLRSAIDV
ncbi:hypothetical protein K7432_013234 [Basidiobolus ranarum]|uniref:Uncharacterized protein n=1 Tax=Basidiobolus ranarum TaxID=34480 RepID=A0ABR2WJL8_9FUNG